MLDLGASQIRFGQSPVAAQKLRELPVRRNACKGTHAIPIDSLEFRSGTVLALSLGAAPVSLMPTVLTVTDLTSTSYRLAGFAASIAGPVDGEVILVSTYGGGGTSRRSEPPSQRVSPERWREQIEVRLRQEGQLLERQRQWCADQGVRCRAELYEEGTWPDFVLQSAQRSQVDLILIGMQLVTFPYPVSADDVKHLAAVAPCPVSMVRLPEISAL
ncbi:MAG: hypothetical protein WAU39_19895 [Polyangiales bacterium]